MHIPTLVLAIVCGLLVVAVVTLAVLFARCGKGSGGGSKGLVIRASDIVYKNMVFDPKNVPYIAYPSDIMKGDMSGVPDGVYYIGEIWTGAPAYCKSYRINIQNGVVNGCGEDSTATGFPALLAFPL